MNINEAKKIIDDLYEEKARNKSNDQDLARTLDILTKTVFGDINRFIFELLQNADDSYTKEIEMKNKEVIFTLTDNYLLFSHNGEHFTEDDVKGISKVGSRDSSKDKNLEKTGYKGIGFKSVFGASDYVQIVSNCFSFKFDKIHNKWKATNEYPWQVIPIWAEEIPQEVSEFLDRRFVTTIIKVNDFKKIKDEIEKLFSDSKIVLFLRNVNNLSFFTKKNLEFKIEKKINRSSNVCTLIFNDKIQSMWLIKDYVSIINEDLQTKLKILSDTECPNKLKEAKSTKLTFAIEIKGDRLIKSSGSIYSYLPTKVDKDFPFLINGDFILNAERTQLLNNTWNLFLFEQIAKHQFYLAKELNSTAYKNDFPIVIKSKFNSTMNVMEKSFNASLENSIENFEFIPSHEGQFLKLKNSIIDTINCSQLIDDMTHYFALGVELASSDINYKKELINLGAINLNIEVFLKILEKMLINHTESTYKENYLKILFFLFVYQSQHDINDSIKKIPLFISNNETFEKSEDLYFPLSDKLSIDFIELNFLDKSIYEKLSAKENMKKWLETLGLKHATKLEIIRKSIFKMITTEHITPENNVPIIRYVFSAYKEGILTDNDYKILKTIRILTNENKMVKVENVYLSKIYNPLINLEEYAVKTDYISDEYIEKSEDIPKWKDFFVTKLGVLEGIKYQVIPKIFRSEVPYNSYLSYIDSQKTYPLDAGRFKHQHFFTDFHELNFLNYTNEYSFSKWFWKEFIEMRIINSISSKKTKYHTYVNEKPIPSYVEYFIKTKNCIPSINGQCYPSKELYSPKFKSLFPELSTIADLPMNLSNSMEEFFQFKTKIDFKEVVNIVNGLYEKEDTTVIRDRLSKIYSYILENLEQLKTEERTYIKLLNLNNHPCFSNELYYFEDERFNTVSNKNKIINLPNILGKEKKTILCDFLGVNFIKKDDYQHSIENKIEDKEFKCYLIEKMKYLSFLPYFSIESNDINKVIEKIIDTNFYKAENIHTNYTNYDGDEIMNEESYVFYENSDFYYIDRWDDLLTLNYLERKLPVYLELEQVAEDFALILKLEEVPIESWLSHRGYVKNKEELEQRSAKLQLHTNNHDFNKIRFLEKEESQTHTRDIVQSVDYFLEPDEDSDNIGNSEEINAQKEAFIPKKSVVNYKFNEISVSNYKSKAKEVDSSEPIKSEEVRSNIGLWCEEFVYQYLLNQNLATKLFWNNKDSESYLPYDIEMIIDNQTFYIEVKGTPSDSKNIFYMSQLEMKQMMENPSTYFIYRVYNAGKENSRIEIIDNIKNRIFNGDIVIGDSEIHI